MNNRQENKLSNYLVRDAVLVTYDAAVQTIPALKTAVGEFRGSVALIQALGNKQGANLAGVAEGKAALRELMTKRAMIVRGKVGPFAAMTKNPDLAAKVAVNASEFTRARDTEADDIAIRILEAAQAHEAALKAEYGLTDAQIDGLEAAIEGYSGLIGNPEASRKARKSITEQIETEFAAVDTLLEEVIDPLVASMQEEHADFARDYANARTINDTRGGNKPAAEAAAPAGPAA